MTAPLEERATSRKVMGEVLAGDKGAAFATVKLGTPGKVRSVVADEDGHFELGAVAPGAYAITAADKGLAAFTGLDVGIDPQQPAIVEVKLVLEPTAPLTGIVRGKGGKPLAGAVVRIEETERPLPLELETALDGRIAAAGRIKGRAYRITIHRAGYLSDGPRLVRAGGPPFDVQLAQGAALEGVVVDEAGVAVANAELAVIGTVEGHAAEDAMPAPVAGTTTGGGWTRLVEGGELGVLTGGIPYPPLVPAVATSSVAAGQPRSDAHGRFAIAELPAGKVVVTTRHPDFAGATSVPVVLVAGETRTIRIELSRGARIVGRVLDEQRLGIEDAQVTTSDGRTVVSDAGGRFGIDHVAGHVTLSVRRLGFLRGEASSDVQAGQREAVLDVTLRRALGRLGGDVTDPTGRAVANARLTITPRGGAEASHATTDGSGRFLVEAMPDGPYRVVIEHPDFARLSLAAVEAGTDVRLVLRIGGGLDGELYDPRTGKPPVDARLTWTSGDDHRSIPLDGRRFRMTGLPSGPCRLTVQARGYPRFERDVDLPESDRPGEITLRDLRIEVELGGQVRGRVRDDRGDPVSGAEVKVVSNASVDPVTTDSDGRFLLDGVPSGSVRVLCRSASETVEVRSNEESRVDLVIAPPR
ncbi:MAG: carboxypeptidase-like regulatory domain-containing protein [Polyangia bacterium]